MASTRQAEQRCIATIDTVLGFPRGIAHSRRRVQVPSLSNAVVRTSCNSNAKAGEYALSCSNSLSKTFPNERLSQNKGIRVVTYDNITDATAAHAALGADLAPRLGRAVAVNFVELAPPKVSSLVRKHRKFVRRTR